MLKRQTSVSDFYGLISIMQHFGKYYIVYMQDLVVGYKKKYVSFQICVRRI